MAFVLIGVAMIAGKLLDWGPTSSWSWDSLGDLFKFAIPFLLALAWWAFCDSTGITKRRAMERDAKNKQDRRDRNIDAMGLGHLHKHRDGKTRERR